MQRIKVVIVALLLLAGLMFGTMQTATAHATWYTHSHYLHDFCNTSTGAYYRVYDWQYASGAHIYYEWRFMWYGCGIA